MNCAAACVLAILNGGPNETGIEFVDATARTGILFEHHAADEIWGVPQDGNTRFGVGAAVSDYDRDGDFDVYIADSYKWPNKLFRNNGDGTFDEVGREAGVDHRGYSHMSLFVDLDNDGFDDLVVLNDSSQFFNQWPRSQIFRNNRDGTFTNVTQGSGFQPAEAVWGGASAGDYDHDGDLDLILAGWFDQTMFLYRNDGEFTFTDVTAEAGIDPTASGSSWTVVFADVDNDGWQDIFCAVDFSEDLLLRNNQDGTFTDVSDAAGTTHVANDMGVAVGDIDGDLDLDLYTTNISGSNYCDEPYGCNMLYLNGGKGFFSDATEQFSIGHSGWGWGAWMFDAELDGDPDLIAVNGWMQPQWIVPSVLYRNSGATGFEEVAQVCGIGHVGNSRGLTPIDLENDGDLDFIICDVLDQAAVYENVSPRAGKHFLCVQAIGTVSNANGVGARVYVTVDGTTQVQEIIAGGSFYASPPKIAHFGVGVVSVIDEVRVVFPSGIERTLLNVNADQYLRVLEQQPGPSLPEENRRRATGRETGRATPGAQAR